jgi:hypothetical protein
MEKKKSVKDTLAEIKMMRKASEKRQAGKNTTSEDIKARMEKREMEKAKQDLKAQKKDARKAGRKFSMPKDKSQYVAPNGKEYMGPGGGPKRERKAKKEMPEQAPKKAAKRRPTGRGEMIAQRYMDNEKRKKDGGSSVVGS